MSKTLFPTDIPACEWVQFEAWGYSQPVSGVIYRLAQPATCGMPLGGVDTGCVDLETSGLLGYCTIFNTHAPRRGPLNLPFLGVNVCGETWVLCDPSQVKRYDVRRVGSQLEWDLLPEPFPTLESLSLEGVRTVKEIHYWGHYPIADLEYEIDAPMSVGLRAWTPFLPGDVESSMIPAVMFEVYLRNLSEENQKGTVAISFPGPTPAEMGRQMYTRREVRGLFRGMLVQSLKASYTLGVIGRERLRLGGELGADGAAWARIGQDLPDMLGVKPEAIPDLKCGTTESGSSVAVDFDIRPGEEKVVRFILAWHSPDWNSGGHPEAERGNLFTHMYAKYFPSAGHAAFKLLEEHVDLLKRILAWQQVIYTEEQLPLWLREVLINNFHLITEIGVWAQALPPIGDWCRLEDGIWGLNESPRSCPGFEYGGNAYLGGLAVQYFFPQLMYSKLRTDKAYQFADGCPTWGFGGIVEGSPPYELTMPARGYQTGQTGSYYVGIAARYWIRTGDDEFLREFYPSLKKATTFIFNLNPEYPYGLISLPDFDLQESYESTPFKGMSAHVASVRLYHLKMMEKIASYLGDESFAKQCREWFELASRLVEEYLWTGSYYRQHQDLASGEEGNVVMGYQLDGEFMACHDGISEGVFPAERVKTALKTLQEVSFDQWGARVWSSPVGGSIKAEEFAPGYWMSDGVHAPGALMLAMTYMYRDQKEIGLDLAHRIMENMICRQRWTWDMPILYHGSTGEEIYGTDYNQMMMCWALPAAVLGKSMEELIAPGGLVDRIIQAAGVVCQR